MQSDDPFIKTFHQWIDVFMRNSMHNAMRHSRDQGWSMSQLNTLMLVYKKGACTVSEIGDSLGVSNAAISQMLERLVQDNLILRTEDPDDRRVKRIRLTEKGSQQLQENLQSRHSWLQDLADDLSKPEKEQICRALEILIDKTKKFEQQTASECS